MSAMDTSLVRAIVLKVAFHGQQLRRCQAALIYGGLHGHAFTADELLVGELVGDDTKISGISIASLASIGLLERVGRCRSPAPSRNGAWVNQWRLVAVKRSTALTWLDRNGFPKPAEQQAEMAL